MMRFRSGLCAFQHSFNVDLNMKYNASTDFHISIIPNSIYI